MFNNRTNISRFMHYNTGKENPMYGRKGKANPMFGRKHSQEAREKMRKARLGKHQSKETIAKRVAKIKGKEHSAETKAKIRKARRLRSGFHLSEETKRKIGNANRGERNGMWKGNKATTQSGRERASRLFKCPKGKEIHHIDGNPLNNSPENIIFVTRKEHMELDGRLASLNSKE